MNFPVKAKLPKTWIAGCIRHVAVDEEVDVLQAELHGVAAVHPTQVVGELRVAVVDRVEQVDIVAGKAADAEDRQVVDGAAGGQSLDAELLQDAVSGEIRTAGGDQDHDAGAKFVEQVGPDRETIAAQSRSLRGAGYTTCRPWWAAGQSARPEYCNRPCDSRSAGRCGGRR